MISRRESRWSLRQESALGELGGTGYTVGRGRAGGIVKRSGVRARPLRASSVPPALNHTGAGLMFWFMRNTFKGSYLALTSARRR